MSRHVLENRLSPIIKYPGGKEKELNYILPALPSEMDRYYEPFVGGGAVFFAVDANEYYINDRSDELISLYNMVKTQNELFFESLEAIEHNWSIISKVVDRHEKEITDIYFSYQKGMLSRQQLGDKISEFVLENTEEFNGLLTTDFNHAISEFVVELCKSIENKMIRMKKIEDQKGELVYEDVVANIEASLKAAFYTHFRMLLNNRKELDISEEFATAIYFFIRQVCYSSMFRYNRNGKFNVPYGGISYNRKSFAGKIQYYHNKDLVRHLEKTTIGNMDFYDFMKAYEPAENDFLFLDPPYDSEFSTYAQNKFDKSDQARLAHYLIRECKANFMIVIKNTEYIASLYPEGTKAANGGSLHVRSFDKKYFVSFQDRNDKNAQHLLITNYAVDTD
ncbi:MAG: DNA adenine methylase [Bacillota bacterium]|nr:DNA adenine methylase [Bacillota bacterium]